MATAPEPAAPGGPVRLALLNDYEVVVAGLAQMLAPYADRVQIVDLDAGDRPRVVGPVDIALYDTFSVTQVDAADIDRVVSRPGVSAVAVYTWNMQPELVERAREKGVRGYLSKSLEAKDLVAALERIVAGETVVAPLDDVGRDDLPVRGGDWPGREHGLSQRQAEVVALVTQGLSNEEIAHRAYLSINTVKSYLRTAYRVMGVSSRSQAVIWGIDHGLAPSSRRRPA